MKSSKQKTKTKSKNPLFKDSENLKTEIGSEAISDIYFVLTNKICQVLTKNWKNPIG
jgi:hypothetical protein